MAESGGPFRPLKAAPGLLQRVLCKPIYHPDERLEPVAMDQPLTAGEILPIAGGIEVIHAPGHCAEPVVLMWRPARMLFADHVCMNIMGLGDPVGFESLKECRAASANLPVFHSMLPASAMAAYSARRIDAFPQQVLQQIVCLIVSSVLGEFEYIGQGRSAWCTKAELSDPVDSETPRRLLMGRMYYIGLDVHKQKISYCVKDSGGKIHAEGWAQSRLRRENLRATLPRTVECTNVVLFEPWFHGAAKRANLCA